MARRILVVDDDIAEISAVKRVLHGAGLQPMLATNSTDALASIEDAPPDAVVVAPACENGGGAALARDLAQRDATRAIPLILLGPVDGDGIVAAEVVARPIEAADLERAVRAALEGDGTRASTARDVQPVENSTANSSSIDPDPDRFRYESDVAALERAAAEQEAIRELRRAEVVVKAPQRHERAEEVVLAAPRLPRDLLQGSFSAVSMPRWLALAARDGATGALQVDADPRRVLWLEEGRLVGADSAAHEERAEEVALRLGLLTRDQHRDVLPELSGLTSRRVAALLVERGFLKPGEQGLLARRRAEEIAFALFTVDAPYRFEPAAAVPVDERLELGRGALALAVEGVRRRWTSARLDGLLGGGATVLAPSAELPLAADLALSAEERRTAELADGLRTVDQIVAGAPLDALSSRQVLAALVEVGALEVKAMAARETPVAAPPSIDLLRLREKLEQVRRADYFVILGLGRGSTGYEVREAAQRMLSELDVHRLEDDPGLAADVREIRRVLQEARDVLSDDELRAQYLASLDD